MSQRSRRLLPLVLAVFSLLLFSFQANAAERKETADRSSTQRASLASIKKILGEVVANQEKLFSELADIKEQLRVIKVRSSQRAG